jgi:class 3 adenylate cyclase
MNNQDIKREEFMYPDSTKKALVSNKNIILYYYYLKGQGIHDPGKRGDAAESLFNDKFEKNFYLNKDEWSSLEEYVLIVEKAMELTGNFELPKIVGSLLPKYQRDYKLQEFSQMARQNLKAFFWGPVEIFKQISFYNYLFNKSKDMEFISGKNGECIIKVKFKDGVNPVYDFVSEWHIEGMLRSVMDLFGVKNGKVDTFLKEYDLELLVKEKFKDLKKSTHINGNEMYLGETLIAEKVCLCPELLKKIIKGENFYIPCDENYNKFSWKIKRDVLMDNKYLVLKKGDIYNTPFFISKISWEKITYFRALRNLLRSLNSDISPLGRQYSRLIHERLAKERESSKLRLQKQRIEEEYNFLLMKNYIHPSFIKKAKNGPIPFKNVFVTNIFLDINRSTQLRKKYGSDVFRVSKNVLLKVVKESMQESAGSWGWLNKVMGDGCYIVMGAYNYFKENQDARHAEIAINFSKLVIKKINALKQRDKLLLPEFCIRFGIESGYVEVGEAHEHDIDQADKKLGLGHLRVFDTDGHAVSLAFRIEQTSKLILSKLKRENENAILLGPSITGIIKKNPDFGFRTQDRQPQ